MENLLTVVFISELLPTVTEDKQLGFFKKWASRCLEKEYLAYGITCIASYSKLNDMVRYEYDRVGELFPQIKLAMLFGKETHLPVYYKSLPGSIKGVSTLHNFLKTADFLNMHKLHFVMDKGFYSRSNVNELLSKHVKFTIFVPISNSFAKEQVEKVRDTITDYKNFIKVNDRNLFCVSSLGKLGKKRIYIHVFYSASIAVLDYESFLNKMRQCEEELKSGNLIEEHKKYYSKYFLLKETPRRGTLVSYNQQAIDEYKKNMAGYLVLITNDIKNPVKALKTYRNKDIVETAFDNLNNSLDMKRLRVHLEESMRGRLFIQFIALIFVSYAYKVMHEKDLFRFGSLSNVIDELELLNVVKFSGNYGEITSEVTKKQKEIFDAFGIVEKTSV